MRPMMRRFALLCAVLLTATAASTRQAVAAIGLACEWAGDSLEIVDETGRPLLAMGGEGLSAFYLGSGGDVLEVVWAEEHVEADGSLVVGGALTDGRRAGLSVAAGQEGTLVVRFSVHAAGEFERLGVRLRLLRDEGFIGLTERAAGSSDALSWQPGRDVAVDLWGTTVAMYTVPTLSAYVPYVTSTAGYGLWLEGSWPSEWRFGTGRDGLPADRQLLVETEGEELALRIVPGPEPLDAVARFARLTGTTFLPPKWAFEPCRWRDEVWDLASFFDGTPSTAPFNTMIVEDVLMMEALGIPCSMYIVDRPWGGGSFGYGPMTVDPRRLPNFPQMLSWLRGRGIHPMLFLGPWVFDELREELIAKGFHVANALFYPVGSELVDFSRPDAVAWWHELLVPYIDLGIAGFKLDRGEEKPPDGQVFRGSYGDGTPYREGHNAYPLWFAAAGAEAFAVSGVDAYFNVARATWTGSSALTAVWGGDADPSALGLRSAIVALQRCSAMNLPIWGSDTGGYNTRPQREALARWLGFSAFCPLMEVGPLGNLAPWAWLSDEDVGSLDGNGYPERTYYDRELLAIWHLYASLHHDLADYVYELVKRCHEDGTPVVRPMALAFPHRPELANAWEQYLYGPDLLVRPVWEEGVSSVEIVLPDGRWVNAWSGELFTGPCVVAVPADLHVVPLFVREGADVALGELNTRWSAAQRAVQTVPDVAALLRGEGW